ncbi:hypothetical protein P175DRAFT_0486605 [Aspergillus ochraceoroseus IBT 24754]|uniref:FAD-binding domain-containing protein n=1 Tax=Aspergillus ochraceoroseus IBT 24754 TaxID=1392256 RepID=A0A2T5LNI7_9EURO|nr:uncharacterized protein P175DRAFT_0486605 [Aspergillus ochraceoroseus IBT 24754]PTU17851.1 hypothetical protein P175DRAFT_0486605 [Aspergillus ochraceoroseus IBT 24754]
MIPPTVVIVGAGLGGLSCAIQCRRWGLRVHVLERAPKILQIGAGIQIPPNAGRVLATYGVLPEIRKKAIQVESLGLRRYADGSLLTERPLGEEFRDAMGAPWLVVHRADYHDILLKEAERLGAVVELDAEGVDVDVSETKVTLRSGKVIAGDVIVGADGLSSVVRDKVLETPVAPFETGDLAYRATFSLEQLQALNDPEIEKLCQRHTVTLWMGPDRHCVFYPIRNGKEYNLVLLRPDNLPTNVRTTQGDLDEMKESFTGWDEVVTNIVSCVPSVLKWKLMHLQELDCWQKNCTTLIGDACHPTLPYQAQGSAMAVEDGGVLGLLLGIAHARLGGKLPADRIKQILSLFENLRKHRTTVNVQGAVHNRWFYHLPDGEEQAKRDKVLKEVNWAQPKPGPYEWASSTYQDQLLGYDVLREAGKVFETWWKDIENGDGR